MLHGLVLPVIYHGAQVMVTVLIEASVIQTTLSQYVRIVNRAGWDQIVILHV